MTTSEFIMMKIIHLNHLFIGYIITNKDFGYTKQTMKVECSYFPYTDLLFAR